MKKRRNISFAAEKTKKQNALLFHLGNLIIILSIVSLVSIYYPIATLYFFSQKAQASISADEFFIVIPKINAAAPVIANVDPWNESVYREALKHGVADAKGSALPGSPGAIFIFAHSSGPPWEQTWYNTVFMRLGELQPGDLIILRKNGKEFDYKVREKKEVWPNEVSYVVNSKKTELILQTCTPIGTDWKRLLVFADQN